MLNSAIAEAQALRDELAFMLERGDNVADRIANLTPPKRTRAPAPLGIEPDSEMERDLKRALKIARENG